MIRIWVWVSICIPVCVPSGVPSGVRVCVLESGLIGTPHVDVQTGLQRIRSGNEPQLIVRKTRRRIDNGLGERVEKRRRDDDLIKHIERIGLSEMSQKKKTLGAEPLGSVL